MMDLDQFFNRLEDLVEWYIVTTNVYPKTLVISSELMRQLTKLPEFYQRRELGIGTTPYSPLVRTLKIKDAVLHVKEDENEKFLYLR